MTLNFSIRISLNKVSLSLKTPLIRVQITQNFQTLQLSLIASEERKTIQIQGKYSQGALHHHDFQQDQVGHLDPTWKQRKMGSNHKTTFFTSFLQMDYFHVQQKQIQRLSLLHKSPTSVLPPLGGYPTNEIKQYL